ncbi:hypothetical protein [Amycolatopsis sp. NPDC052450]|uniref:hypothetical protein n=1 Tax=Amycolatopsis sp. NPDC052450 TaxID=3363937 RepID=UPI0037CB1B33
MNEERKPAAEPDVGSFTEELLTAVREEALDDIADALAILANAGSAATSAAVLNELVDRCAATIRARFPAEPEDLYTVALTDRSGCGVTIDCMPPGPRAALRALLAELAGDSGGRAIQVRLAGDGEATDFVFAVFNLLMWLTELSDTTAGTPPVLSCFTP